MPDKAITISNYSIICHRNYTNHLIFSCIFVTNFQYIDLLIHIK